MDLLLGSIRGNVASRPLWLFLAVLAGLYLVHRLIPARLAQTSTAWWMRITTTIAPIGALIFYVGVSVWYALVPQQFDPAEPTMTAVAWLFSVGKPIYHGLDSAERYSHVYGPMAFVIPGLGFRILGPTMLAAKAVGVASALLAVGLTYLALGRVSPSRQQTTFVCGLCVMQFLMFGNLTFWSRPEPLQLLCVSAALLAATRRAGVVELAIISTALGALWSLKFTGPLYSLPVVALVWANSGRLAAGLVVAGAAFVSWLPFVVFPNVSLENYALWVRLSGRNGLRILALKQNIEWALFFLLPLLGCLARQATWSRQTRAFVPALVTGICGVVVAAAKPGAGPYHLVPFLPLIGYGLASVLPNKRTAGPRYALMLTAFVTTTALAAAVQQAYFLRFASDPAVAASYQDIGEYVANHRDEVIEMGYASPVRMTFARTLLAFHNGSYLLDGPAIQEQQLSGVEVPRSTIAALQDCSVTTWLVPRSGEPFRLPNVYGSAGDANLFPEAFIDAFHASYRREAGTRYYDVWRCRK